MHGEKSVPQGLKATELTRLMSGLMLAAGEVARTYPTAAFPHLY
jgi:hypothetical protein